MVIKSLKPRPCRTCEKVFTLTSKGQFYCEGCQVCSVEGCEKPRGKRSYCDMHYDRLITTGELGGARSKIVENGGPCFVGGCDEIATAAGLCNMHYKRRKRLGEVGAHGRLRARVGSGITVKGYRYVRIDGQEYKEHRLVMERVLGRPLSANENVHHKDGDKLNNDPANLELWVKTQPCGQRATDRVKAALALLKEYPDLAALEGYRLVALESQAATNLLLGMKFNPTAGITAGLI